MTHPSLPEEEVARHWDENAVRWAEQVRRGWDTCRETWPTRSHLKAEKPA